MGEGSDFREAQAFVGEVKRELSELSGVAFAPGGRGEVKANFDSPANIERVIVKTAKADYLPMRFFAYDPGSISDLPTLAFVPNNVAPTGAKTDKPARISHCFFVTKDD